MEEENKIVGEQPSTAGVQTVATDVENGTCKADEGSPLGKFKNADTLLDAYNELQSEFTRKCQKLSETEKRLNQLSADSKTAENQSNKFALEKYTSEFLSAHKNAEKFMEEIAGELISDESLGTSMEGLEKAYTRVLEKKYIPESELVGNKEFLEKYIYSNDEIKNKIIRDYVSTLQSGANPIVISNSGFSRGVAEAGKPKSLEEARALVENMFR